MTQLLHHRNDKTYLVSDLKIYNPTEDEISSFQYAHAAMQNAPNEKIMWLQGEYVEGDSPNLNGQEWSSDEVSIKSVTANLMPVTIMHDLKTAVGVIADTRIKREETSDKKEKVTVSTVLAIWAHRFPEIAEEIRHNHEAGSLMQSQECDAPSYECSTCDKTFVKPVREQDHCSHLQNKEASRRLLNVTFTGTGLIFGSRGAKGANPNANLDTVIAEVAQWSDARNGITITRERSTVDEITIKRNEYDELKARPSREDFDALQAKFADAEKATLEAEKASEAAEVKLKTAEEAKATADKELSELKDEKKADELAKERLTEISEDLTKALPDSIKDRLDNQARSMSDDEWQERIAELSELVKVEVKAGDGDTFTKEEISKFNGQGKKTDTSLDPHALGKSLYKNATAGEKS